MQTTSIAGSPAHASYLSLALPNAGAQAVACDPRPYSPAPLSSREAGGSLPHCTQRPAASQGWMAEQLADDHSYVSRMLLGITGRLIRLHAVKPSDRDDLLQNVRVELLRRWTWYKPSHSGEKTFATRLVRNAIGSQLRAGRRRKRNWARLDSGCDDEPSPANLVTDDLARRHRGVVHPSAQIVRDRRFDIAAARESLPPKLALICRLLSHYSPTETAFKLGMPRSSLYRRMREIADHFEDLGVANYLPEQRALSGEAE